MNWKAWMCMSACFAAGFAGAAVRVRSTQAERKVDPVLANAKVDAQLGRVLSGLLAQERLENAVSWAGP